MGRKGQDMSGTGCQAQKAFVLDLVIAMKDMIVAE